VPQSTDSHALSISDSHALSTDGVLTKSTMLRLSLAVVARGEISNHMEGNRYLWA
jgi:hypothetical protein